MEDKQIKANGNPLFNNEESLINTTHTTHTTFISQSSFLKQMGMNVNAPILENENKNLDKIDTESESGDTNKDDELKSIINDSNLIKKIHLTKNCSSQEGIQKENQEQKSNFRRHQSNLSNNQLRNDQEQALIEDQEQSNTDSKALSKQLQKEFGWKQYDQFLKQIPVTNSTVVLLNPQDGQNFANCNKMNCNTVMNISPTSNQIIDNNPSIVNQSKKEEYQPKQEENEITQNNRIETSDIPLQKQQKCQSQKIKNSFSFMKVFIALFLIITSILAIHSFYEEITIYYQRLLPLDLNESHIEQASLARLDDTQQDFSYNMVDTYSEASNCNILKEKISLELLSIQANIVLIDQILSEMNQARYSNHLTEVRAILFIIMEQISDTSKECEV